MWGPWHAWNRIMTAFHSVGVSFWENKRQCYRNLRSVGSLFCLNFIRSAILWACFLCLLAFENKNFRSGLASPYSAYFGCVLHLKGCSTHWSGCFRVFAVTLNLRSLNVFCILRVALHAGVGAHCVLHLGMFCALERTVHVILALCIRGGFGAHASFVACFASGDYCYCRKAAPRQPRVWHDFSHAIDQYGHSWLHMSHMVLSKFSKYPASIF